MPPLSQALCTAALGIALTERVKENLCGTLNQIETRSYKKRGMAEAPLFAGSHYRIGLGVIPNQDFVDQLGAAVVVIMNCCGKFFFEPRPALFLVTFGPNIFRPGTVYFTTVQVSAVMLTCNHPPHVVDVAICRIAGLSGQCGWRLF